jgi:4a-hydroxytetrahydrobiopterin dehydratase
MTVLQRAAASAAIEPLGWRVILQTFVTSVPVSSLQDGAAVAAAAAAAVAPADAARLRIDLRDDRVEVVLPTLSRRTGFDEADIAATRAVTEALAAAGTAPRPLGEPGTARSAQALEICIDALDIPAIRPFWRAVMAYGDEPGGAGPSDAVVDPAGQGPTIWFQQMAQPRPQRNRIHFDIVVPHDEADRRREAALAAGGVLVSDAEARAFWILADTEGNEICICTWQDRDS